MIIKLTINIITSQSYGHIEYLYIEYIIININYIEI